MEKINRNTKSKLFCLFFVLLNEYVLDNKIQSKNQDFKRTSQLKKMWNVHTIKRSHNTLDKNNNKTHLHHSEEPVIHTD